MDGAAEIMAKAQPNAVVLEKSSHDEADSNAQRISKKITVDLWRR